MILISEKQNPFIFVEKNDFQGVSKNSGQPYHIRQVKVSDGLESYTLSYDEHTVIPPLSKGDKVDVKVLLTPRTRDFAGSILSISPAAVLAK